MAEQSEFSLRWELFDPENQQPAHFWQDGVRGPHRAEERRDSRPWLCDCIDTVCCKYGWLTAIDVLSREVWQANRWGMLRDSVETSHRDQLRELLQPAAMR